MVSDLHLEVAKVWAVGVVSMVVVASMVMACYKLYTANPYYIIVPLLFVGMLFLPISIGDKVLMAIDQ